MTVSVLLRLDESLKRDLDDVASSKGTTTQAFIRQAIVAALAVASSEEQAWCDWLEESAAEFNDDKTPAELDAERAQLWA